MTFRKHILYLLLCLTMLVPVSVSARDHSRSDVETARERYARELRTYKHQFLAEKLRLSSEQLQEFFTLYDAMEDEKEALSAQLRNLEQQINENTNATDIELETAAATLFAQKEREGAIEQRYFEQFRTVLPPRQLFLLKGAERQFNRAVMERHRNAGRDRNNQRHSGR